MSKRLNLIVGDEVPDMLIELAGSERRQGRWISALVKSMHEQQQQIVASDLEQTDLCFSGEYLKNTIWGYSTRMKKCPKCSAIEGQVKNGRNPTGTQRYKCKACGRLYTPESTVTRNDQATQARAFQLYLED